ncbi:MAG: AarF/ABC1/UbiB kinase family protein [Phycisphaerales bacterium]|nr:AarF/ABC1/UbiB kinase family protein [Phycisphaerales bacterium]MCB9862710.1 AarF/ABC1/UbiB kinase family protein [Phycisphaerales bacterium]
MSLATLPRTVRTFARLRVILQVMSRHGFGHFVDRLQLTSYLPTRRIFRRKSVDEPDAADPLESVGQRFVRVCEELGPTFIKLGQIASTRPDILPLPVLKALSNLQDRVSPFSATEAKRIFEHDIGQPIAKAFAHFNDTPFASGSIAQAHEATTIDGQRVVVKIKRPGIDHVVRLDVYVLKFLAEQAESLFPELRPYRPRMLIEEFTQTLERELDFINEASATTRFYEAFKSDEHVSTPQVYWNLTGPSVLTLQYLEGARFREALSKDNVDVDRPLLARRISECFVHQFFELGMFHADPHPGNLLITPPSHVKLVDFGIIGQLDEQLLDHLVVGLLAIVRKEYEILVDVIADLDCFGDNTDRTMLARDLRVFVNKWYGLPVRRMDMSVIFGELIETVRKNDVTLPRDFVAAFKALTIISGVVLQLDPEFNIVEIVQPRLSALLRDRFSAKRLARATGITAWHVAAIMREGPRLVRDVMRGVGRGRFQINIKHENLDYLARELDRSSNRLASAIIMASTIICGTMLLSMNADILIFGKLPLRYLGLFGYLIASGMAVWLIVAIMRSGKLS